MQRAKGSGDEQYPPGGGLLGREAVEMAAEQADRAEQDGRENGYGDPARCGGGEGGAADERLQG
ncbi:hypothetical protein AB0269_10275 [Microbacterium sp. NPDC077644]|uniref:hypothetical protein n=1 Tax=Microbacterium sp. NPDC077644 TaxID=3155055 RepID=UPI00344D4F91